VLGQRKAAVRVDEVVGDARARGSSGAGRALKVREEPIRGVGEVQSAASEEQEVVATNLNRVDLFRCCVRHMGCTQAWAQSVPRNPKTWLPDLRRTQRRQGETDACCECIGKRFIPETDAATGETCECCECCRLRRQSSCRTTWVKGEVNLRVNLRSITKLPLSRTHGYTRPAAARPLQSAPLHHRGDVGACSLLG
jgi:hypothetical protein